MNKYKKNKMFNFNKGNSYIIKKFKLIIIKRKKENI